MSISPKNPFGRPPPGAAMPVSADAVLLVSSTKQCLQLSVAIVHIACLMNIITRNLITANITISIGLRPNPSLSLCTSISRSINHLAIHTKINMPIIVLQILSSV